MPRLGLAEGLRKLHRCKPALRITAISALSTLLSATTGCHSAFIEATVSNQSGAPISIVEVDYPSASFGTQSLPASAVYHYRFKVIGSGATKVLWTDAHHMDHTSAGPALHEDQEGNLTIAIGPAEAHWTTHLQPPSP